MAIALNLAGLFEMPTPRLRQRKRRRRGGAFATGALAAFIATPCTGPFMGAALGAALVLPWPAALAVFAGLGLGLALPFLLLGFVPALRRLLPRPGAWMETFRRILSVPMWLTAIGARLGAGAAGRRRTAMASGLVAALLLALVLWSAGLRQRAGKAFGVGAGCAGRCSSAVGARSRCCAGGRRQGATRGDATAAVQRGAGSPRCAPRASRCSSISPPTGA